MKVICVGCVKTGTTSLREAFTRLGYKCAVWDEKQVAAWHRGEIEDCMQAAAKFEFLRDWPWPQLYRELDAAFPGSKFILTLRDPDKWVESFIAHVRRVAFAKDGTYVGHPERDQSWRMTYGYNPAQFLDKPEYLIETIYEKRLAEVRAYFADRPADLLEIDLIANPSYKKICKFVGHAPVKWKYPHMNKRPDV